MAHPARWTGMFKANPKQQVNACRTILRYQLGNRAAK